MRKQSYETYDGYFNLKGFPSTAGLFFDIGHIIHRHVATVNVRFVNPNTLFQAVLWQHNEEIIHVREGYDVFGLLGNLGGITQIFYLLFGIMLYPYSEHSFLIKAMKKLYYARTRDNEIFRSDGKKSAIIKRKIDTLLGGE